MVSDLRKLQAMENTVAGLNRALTNCTNDLTECHRKLARETENLDNSNSHIRELRNKITELTELRVTAALNTQTVLDILPIAGMFARILIRPLCVLITYKIIEIYQFIIIIYKNQKTAF